MAILLISDYGEDDAFWRCELSKRISELDFRMWPDTGRPEEVEIIVIDTLMSSEGGFAPFRNLKMVCYLGHGVGDVLRDRTLQPHVAITRMNSPAIARGLSEYVLHAVLARHLRVDDYAEQQRNAVWRDLPIPPASSLKAAVLGLGIIGRSIVKDLQHVGFQVTGWRRSPGPVGAIDCVHGFDALPSLLSQCDFVVGALPETDETIGLIDRDMISRMKPGAYIVNIGRGSLINEDHLIEAVETAHLSGATLDVFRTEPLPSDSPLWGNPKIKITPHAGAPDEGDPLEPLEEVAENYNRLKQGAPLKNLVDRKRGY